MDRSLTFSPICNDEYDIDICRFCKDMKPVTLTEQYHRDDISRTDQFQDHKCHSKNGEAVSTANNDHYIRVAYSKKGI